MPKTRDYRLAKVRWGSITNAVIKGNIEALKALIAAGADINKTRTLFHSDSGWYKKQTLIAIALRNNKLHIVEALLSDPFQVLKS